MSIIIGLDPGPGGGLPDTQQARRGDITLDLALMIRGACMHRGVTVFLTRKGREFVSVGDRIRRLNAAKVNALVSLYVNFTSNPATRGFESFTAGSPDSGVDSKAFQWPLHQVLIDMWGDDRGMKTGGFRILHEVKVPAVLLKFTFMLNALDAELLADNIFLQGQAEALASALAVYKQMVTHKIE